MIPLRLNLQNFLAYRSPNPIVFDGVHLACLTGENGAGKSSLLDAITWAIWGKARTRHDNDLMHLNTNRMFVELDFLHEGQKYRITRSRDRRGRSGRGQLELFIYDEDDQLNGISEPSTSATQKRINDLLRLEYDTFVNSAFLKQGEADAFTVKRPSERKQILSNILGLEKWATYEDHVKAHLKSIDEQVGVLNVRIKEIDEQLKTEAERKQAVEDAEAKHALIEAELKDAEGRYEQVKSARKDLENARQQQQAANDREREYTAQLDRLKQNKNKVQQEIEQHQALLGQREAIEDGYRALQEAREASAELNTLYRQYTEADRQIAELKSQLNSEKTRLETQADGERQQIRALAAQISAAAADELAILEEQVATLEEKAAERERINEALGKLKTERAGLEATNKQLFESMNEIKDRLDALAEVDGATCPLCGQALSAEHRAEMLEQLQAEGTQQGDTYRANTTRMEVITEEHNEALSTLEALAGEVAKLPRLQQQLGKARQQASAAQQAQDKRDKHQATLDALEAQLADETFGAELRQQVQQLKADRDSLGYDEDMHSSHADALKKYKGYDQQYARLQLAQENLPKDESRLAEIEQDQATLHEKIAAQEARQTELAGKVATLETLVVNHDAIHQQVMRLRTEVSQANQAIGQAQQALAALASMRESRGRYEEKRAKAIEQKSIYEELRTAFGKKGVPAMIIEAAIPELQDTTNDMLTRITDGRMAVRFNMQREKITGGTEETLDIEISDELGTRNYDLYSGGEAFRINFAIRVAISKMLARRAGAHLEILFIDEGFGTQDADGRNKLVEAINAIKDEFDLILVITHIDELKDAFPIHINVEKTPNGSQVVLR